MPPADVQVSTGSSTIAGLGLFARSAVAVGDVVVRFVDAPTRAENITGVNHSCDPNLGFTDDRTLVAKRDIGAGEELTVDYATAVAESAWVLWCHCETYRCRQVIEGTDWQIPQLQERYAGWWAPAVQALIDTGVRQPG